MFVAILYFKPKCIRITSFLLCQMSWIYYYYYYHHFFCYFSPSQRFAQHKLYFFHQKTLSSGAFKNGTWLLYFSTATTTKKRKKKKKKKRLNSKRSVAFGTTFKSTQFNISYENTWKIIRFPPSKNSSIENSYTILFLRRSSFTAMTVLLLLYSS